jgi:hypothetical protein
MTRPISRAEFEALVARAGLALGEAQKDELHRAYQSLELLLERVRRPLPPEAEPASIFGFNPSA